jgi:outer membrane receptor for ferrienterochelin and colicins
MNRLLYFLFFTGFLSAQNPADTAAFSIDLDEFVITAQFEPTHHTQAVHKVDVIKKELILNRGAVNLEQALIGSPAIRLYNDPILGTSVRMRGISSSNVAILIDGVPVIGRLNGAIDLSQISMQNVERIEIVEGALSNIYGSNAAGGVINIITKRGQSSAWNGELRSQLESVGQQNYEASFGYRFRKWTANIHGRYFDYQQYPVDSLRLTDLVSFPDGTNFTRTRYPLNPKTQWSYGTFLRYQLDDESSIIAKYDHNKEHIIDYGSIRRPQYKPYAYDQFYRTERNDVSLNLRKKWQKLFLDFTAAYNGYSRITDNKRFNLEPQTFDSLEQSSDTTIFTTYFNRTILSVKPASNIDLMAGLNFSREAGSGDRIVNNENPDSTIGLFTEWAPFAELKYSGIRNLSASLSGRYTLHSVYKGKFTPSLQLKYTLSPAWSIRAGYAQGYRSPSLKELYLEFLDVNHNIIGNTDLKPETSHDIQMTLAFEPNKALRAQCNVYQTTIKDQISLYEYDDLKYIYDNVDEYQVRGFQPRLYMQKWNISLNIAATMGFWSTNIEADDTPLYGKVFDLNNTLVWQWKTTGIGFTVNHRHIGAQPNYSMVGDIVELRTTNAYELLDASLNKRFLKDRLQCVAGVQNMLDVRTIDTFSDDPAFANQPVSSNTVQRGRSWFIQLAWTF